MISVTMTSMEQNQRQKICGGKLRMANSHEAHSEEITVPVLRMLNALFSRSHKSESNNAGDYSNSCL